ncbi:hypothetical protein Vadar_025801 [Vaccinium darrowii]|uniref:Uncharacterized protein n=1 Tax=Vaccinium darrowii TaxID=229202 RepID=A0ACB7YQW0_9ERIC|nr:hypothetical protein Vadar_025801 [Vaccinium darrowii]
MAERIAEKLFSKLGSYAIQQIGLAWGVEKELAKMENNISTIRGILLHAEERQLSDGAVKAWLERLEDILYDADDLLDEVATETKRRQVETQNGLVGKVHHFFTTSPSLAFRYVVGRKLKAIEKRLDEIVLEMNKFKFLVKQVGRPIETLTRDQTHSFVNTPTIVGREIDKEKIVRLLLFSNYEENVPIIPIVGMGGLGKTTLAQLVYNDHRIQNHFAKRIWACISDDFNIERILQKILEAGGANRGSECLTIKETITKAIPATVRHVSFKSTTYCKVPRPLSRAKKLRTIIYPENLQRKFGSSVDPKIVRFRSLRVLENCCFEDFSELKKIGKLKLLRYLNLKDVTNLPKSLCKLINLEYLDLWYSGVFELPEGFEKLINLRFLRLSISSTCLSEKDFCGLTSLRMLIIIDSINLTSLGEGIELLSCLRELTIRNCHMLSSLPAGLRHLVSLERLAIRFCPLFNWSDGDYDLKGLKSLKKLGFYSLPKLVTLPKELQDAAATLTHLEIEQCARFTLPSECILPNLRSLQSLKILNCPEVESLPEGMQRLTKLQFLSISYCSLDSRTYREGGEDWHKIADIPTTEIFSNIEAFQT